MPFRGSFVDPHIFEHPALVAFLEQILGPEYVCLAFDSNIPYPGTDYQRWHRDGYYDLVGTGPNGTGKYHPTRVNMTKGSLWIHDNRPIHRGTPNRSGEPRDELCMPMSFPWVHPKWLQEETAPQVTRQLWNSLSEHARQVLRWQRVKD